MGQIVIAAMAGWVLLGCVAVAALTPFLRAAAAVRASETTEVMEQLLRDLRPDCDPLAVHTLATIAATSYLEYAEEIPPACRPALMATVLDEVIEAYLPWSRPDRSLGGRRALGIRGPVATAG